MPVPKIIMCVKGSGDPISHVRLNVERNGVQDSAPVFLDAGEAFVLAEKIKGLARLIRRGSK